MSARPAASRFPGVTATRMIVLPGGGYAEHVAHEAEPIADWLNGLAALTPGADPVDFAVLGYAITSMETETYRPARLILLGEDATPELRRATSLDALVAASAPPLFMWHTSEDPYVAVEHIYRLAAALATSGVPHTVHVFAHGPHSLGLARGAGDAAAWTTLAASWIDESQRRARVRGSNGRDVRRLEEPGAQRRQRR
jgi:acetyl esterase/lipase